MQPTRACCVCVHRGRDRAHPSSLGTSSAFPESKSKGHPAASPVNQIRPRRRILPFPSGIPGQQATGRDPIISRRVGWSALQALSVPHAYKALEVRSSVRPVAIAAPRPYKRRHTHSGPVTDAVTNRAAVTSGLLELARSGTPRESGNRRFHLLLMGIRQETNALSNGESVDVRPVPLLGSVVLLGH